MMRLDLSTLDYTTLSRLSQHLTRRLRLVPTDEGIRGRCPTARSGDSPEDPPAVLGGREDSDSPRGLAGRREHHGAVPSRRAEPEFLRPVEQGVSRNWEEAAGRRHDPRGDIDGSDLVLRHFSDASPVLRLLFATVLHSAPARQPVGTGRAQLCCSIAPNRRSDPTHDDPGNPSVSPRRAAVECHARLHLTPVVGSTRRPAAAK